jgi:hypothetical protein
MQSLAVITPNTNRGDLVILLLIPIETNTSRNNSELERRGRPMPSIPSCRTLNAKDRRRSAAAATVPCHY